MDTIEWQSTVNIKELETIEDLIASFKHMLDFPFDLLLHQIHE